jgi:hypothetical protein
VCNHKPQQFAFWSGEFFRPFWTKDEEIQLTPFLRHFDCARERARDRLRYCERERDRFLDRADLLDDRQARTARKLEQDVEKAERDVSWAEHRFNEAAATDEASLAFRREAVE